MTGWKSRRGRLTRYGALVILGQLLEFLAARQDAASVLLSPGPHLSVGLLVLVAVMVLVRLAVHLVIPGLVAAEAIDWLVAGRADQPEPVAGAGTRAPAS